MDAPSNDTTFPLAPDAMASERERERESRENNNNRQIGCYYTIRALHRKIGKAFYVCVG